MEKSEMKTIAIIQARMGSKRLPGKVLEQIEKKPMLYHIVDRVKRVSQIEDIVIATSNEKTDEPIVDFCVSNSIKYFAGSENNVLDRFYQAANKYNIMDIYIFCVVFSCNKNVLHIIATTIDKGAIIAVYKE